MHYFCAMFFTSVSKLRLEYKEKGIIVPWIRTSGIKVHVFVKKWIKARRVIPVNGWPTWRSISIFLVLSQQTFLLVVQVKIVDTFPVVHWHKVNWQRERGVNVCHVVNDRPAERWVVVVFLVWAADWILNRRFCFFH